MTEVLSQDEIDALLNAVSAGGDSSPAESLTKGGLSDFRERKRLKVYDFRRPDKFSKDQIRTLQMVHETFARLTVTSLSAQLRSLVYLHVVSVDQLTYEEFTRSIPSPTTLGIVNMDPLKGSAVLEIDPSITFCIIDRLFGGKGEPIHNNRELTDIELSVIEGLMVRLLANLRESWANVIDLRPRLGTIETNPQFASVVPPTSMVVLITFDMKVGETEGMVNFCVPYITIEPVAAKLSAQYWYAAINRNTSNEDLVGMQEQIEELPLTLTARLVDTSMDFQSINSLQEGDILRFDNSPASPVEVYVGDRLKFLARPGTLGKKRSVQVFEVSSEVDERILHSILMGQEGLS